MFEKKSIVAVALILGCTSWVNADEASNNIELLLSESLADRERAEIFVLENRTALIVKLVNEINNGDLPQIGDAAYSLGLVISPFLRGKESGRRFYVSELKVLRRPVHRQSSVAESDAVRRCLQAAIMNILDGESTAAAQKNAREAVLEVCCETLAEVADEATVAWVLKLLRKERSPAFAESMVKLLDSILGMRPVYREGGLCGLASGKEVASFKQSQRKQIGKAHTIVNGMFSETRYLSERARIQKALREWRSYFIRYQKRNSGSFPYYEGWLFEQLEPLVRFGEPAVDLLRARRDREKTIEAKAVWETAISAIVGYENEDLVKELFGGSDTHIKYACEIVVAAGSKKWFSELTALQFTRSQRIASRAIATIHKTEGLDALRRGFEAAPSNFWAKYAIEELERRIAEGMPPRLKRY